MNSHPESAEARTRVLIVDDDQELCSMLGEYLGPEGFTVETAGTGSAGASSTRLTSFSVS